MTESNWLFLGIYHIVVVSITDVDDISNIEDNNILQNDIQELENWSDKGPTI
jgi:hypothetical protein